MSEVANFIDLIEKQKNSFIEKNLSNGNLLSWEAECLFAKQQLMKNDFTLNVAKNNQASLSAAIQNVAAIGISLNPALQHAYLVPRDGFICLDISYRGLVKLATDSGVVKWAKAELVYENDSFKYRGINVLPDFEADVFGDRGELIGGYCIAKLRDGDFLVDTMSVDEIHKIRNVSKAYQSKKGPWMTWPGEMAKKTLVKRAHKSWPEGESKARTALAIDVLNAHEGSAFTLEQQSEYLDKLRSGNALEFILLRHELGDDLWSALYNSFDKGHKVKDKKLADDLETEGVEKLISTAADLAGAVAADDRAAVEEILEEIPLEVLKIYATDEEKTALIEFMEAS